MDPLLELLELSFAVLISGWLLSLGGESCHGGQLLLRAIPGKRTLPGRRREIPCATPLPASEKDSSRSRPMAQSRSPLRIRGEMQKPNVPREAIAWRKSGCEPNEIPGGAWEINRSVVGQEYPAYERLDHRFSQRRLLPSPAPSSSFFLPHSESASCPMDCVIAAFGACCNSGTPLLRTSTITR